MSSWIAEEMSTSIHETPKQTKEYQNKMNKLNKHKGTEKFSSLRNIQSRCSLRREFWQGHLFIRLDLLRIYFSLYLFFPLQKKNYKKM